VGLVSVEIRLRPEVVVITRPTHKLLLVDVMSDDDEPVSRRSSLLLERVEVTDPVSEVLLDRESAQAESRGRGADRALVRQLASGSLLSALDEWDVDHQCHPVA
jgi:hypothetical protein